MNKETFLLCHSGGDKGRGIFINLLNIYWAHASHVPEDRLPALKRS